MDNIIAIRNASVLIDETKEEFYLNPRDIILNGKTYDSYNKVEVLHHLPMNELLILLLDENIAIVDLKESVAKQLQIIQMINHSKLHEQFFSHKEKTKTSNEKNSKDFDRILFKTKENDLHEIKNFFALEMKGYSNTVYLIIEYISRDFIVLKFDDVKEHKESVPIFKMSQTDYMKFFKIKKHEDILANALLNNFSSQIVPLDNCLNILDEEIEKEEDDDDDEFKSKAISNNIVASFAYRLYESISILTINSEDKIKVECSHEVNFDVKDFHVYFTKTNFFITTLSVNNKVIIDKFAYKMNKGLQSKCVHSQKLKCLPGNISLIRIETINGKLILTYSQLNKILIYLYEEGVFILSNLINFTRFSNIPIQFYCVLENLNLFVFNSNGEYCYEHVDIKGENKQVVNKMEKNLSLCKQIFSISKFTNGLGVYILSSHNTFKLTNFNIIYFIPEFIRDEVNMTTLIKLNQKFYKELLSQDLKPFFTFDLSEFLLLFLRNKGLIQSINEAQTSNFSFNEYFNLLLYRVRFYLHHVYSSDSSLKIDIDSIKTYMIDKFRSIYSDSIEDLNDNYEYVHFLQNKFYSCDFCKRLLIEYDHHGRTYTCENKHIAYSCCVTYLPYLESTQDYQHFLTCEDCNLFYSKNFSSIGETEGNKVKICLVCQKALSKILLL